MRIRIIRKPTVASIDGIRFDWFEEGQQYEVGNSVGALLLAEGWAEPVPLDAPRSHVRFTADDPFDNGAMSRDRQQPPNLEKEDDPPLRDRAVAADFKSRRRPRRS